MLAIALPARAEIPVPPLRARVTDLAGLLPPDREQRLEATLARHEEATGNQIAVLTLPTTSGEPIERFALRVAEAWKLGREGVDDGVLVVVADQDRAARIEVGYGLEGAIPDAVAKRVIEEVMIPSFRRGDFAGGIEAGVDALAKAARGEALPPPRRASRRDGPSDPLGLVFFAALLSSVLWLPFRGGKRRLLGAVLGGLTAAGVTWFFLRVLAFSALAFGLGMLFGWMGPGGGGRRRGGWGGGGWGGGGWSGGGGGWSGGGGGFGGGGASGRW